ncbi:hypothetical protein [Cupriavidus sp.]|uniref:hypothetical protein n=1 Tax=Cupriavidus sp. TaxID=1873897 RepID=UPI003D0F454A
MSDASTLWAIHVEGPDDIIAVPSRDAAEREAVLLNQQFASVPKSKHAPVARAVVIEWPYTAAGHAQSLGRDWDKKGNRR